MNGEQQSAWSIGLGRWFGVNVRLHMLFIVFAVLTFYFGWRASAGENGSEYYVTAFAALGILLASIFLHEIAHGFTASAFGGSLDSIELFPWGGSSEIELPPSRKHQFFVHVAGPFSNLVICLGCLGILLVDPHFSKSGNWSQLFHPLHPVIISTNPFSSTVALIFWVNWLVFLANLLPISPFDGGSIVRSLIPLIWPNTRTDQVYLGSMIVAMMTSIGLCVMAWICRESQTETFLPLWLVLLLLAIVVFFGARRQTQIDLMELEDLIHNDNIEHAERMMERIENRAFDEFDEDGTEDEHHISDWLYKQKFEVDFDTSPELTDEERVDQILDKINQVGIEGLSEYERFILMRVSAIYRDRRNESDITS